MKDERSLLKEAQHFDPLALSNIHDHYYPGVYRYLVYRVGDPMIAEDLASEVFVRFLNALKAKRGPRQTLRGWLFGVASNLAGDHFREISRHPHTELNNMLVSRQDLVQEVELNFQKEELRRAITMLTPDQQHILALRFGSGCSISETAKAVGKKENAVKALQFRAIEALRKKVTS